MAPSSPPPTPPPPLVPRKDTPPVAKSSKSGKQQKGKDSASTPIDPAAAASTLQSGPSQDYDDVVSPRPRSHSRSFSLESDADSTTSFEMNQLSSSGEDSDEETGISDADRQRRKKKKKRRRGFGGISAEGSGKMRDGAGGGSRRMSLERRSTDGLHTEIVNGIAVTKEEKKLADMNVMRSMAVNATLILLWYTFSLLISIYNKWMFDKKRLNFGFPLFVTSMHMIVQFTLSSLVLLAFPVLRPSYAVAKQYRALRQQSGAGTSSRRRSSASAPAPPRPREDDFDADSPSEDEVERLLEGPSDSQGLEKPEGPVMSKRFYATRIAPCGLATGLDIGLGNMSMKYITLTFYTMCKSSSLAFVLIFAFLFRLEKPTVKLISIIGVMTLGVVMMVFGEVEFQVVGFVLVMTASMLSGLRWSLTQLLLLRNPATGNPFSSIFFLAPVMFVGLIIFAIPIEGIGALAARWQELADEKGLIMSIGLLLFPGTIAFCMTASEFALLKRTSVVTLSVCGIFKEVLTISAAATVFGDRLTPVNISGLFVSIASIAAYNYLKISKMRGDAVRDVVVEVEGEEVLEEMDDDNGEGSSR